MSRWLLRFVLPPAVTLVLLLAAWEIAGTLWRVPDYLLPTPREIALASVTSASVLLRGTMLTGLGAALGFALSAVVGVLIAVVFSLSRIVERAVFPFTVFLQTVPLVAIAPMLIVWSGYGLRAVTIAAFIVSVFPVIANTLIGLRSVDPALRDMFRLYGASPWARLWKLSLPSALPNIFTGLRIAAGLAVIGAIVGEFVSGHAGENAGLGIIVMSSMRDFSTDLLFAAIVLSSLLGLALFGLVNASGYLMLRRWHASAQG